MTRGSPMTSQTISRVLVVMVALLVPAFAREALCDTFPPAPPVKEQQGGAPLPERMRTLITTQCASCHESGALASKPGSIGAAYDLRALSLDELAADPGLVRPGFAEASPLFQALISRHRPSDLGPGGLSAHELLAVRDWIASLPPATACGGEDVAFNLPKAPSGGLLVSLHHLAGSCVPAGRIAEYRGLADALLGALTSEIKTFRSEDANGLALAVESVHFDRLTGSDLEALRDLMKAGAVPLDGLAALVLDHGLLVRTELRPRVAELARLWTRDVDLRRAASEAGLSQDRLRELLQAVGRDVEPYAHRLLQGALPRPLWEGLKRVLSGDASSLPLLKSDTTIDVVLTSDVLKAKTQDLLSLRVVASHPCHLTIVSIDTAGRALVLFPNEVEETNLIPAGAAVTVPGANAGYQVRFDKAGTETFVAVCQRGRTSLDGVKVDYEKQRFPVLGDWRGFIAVMDERQTKLEAEKQSGEARRSRRRGRNRSPEAKPAAPPVDPKSNAEGWAALRITVE